MANRFWVGGAGTWDSSTTTHWSLTTGGAGGASVPGAGDTAVFDGSSGGGTVTLSGGGGNVVVGALDMSSAAAMTMASSGGGDNLEVRGNVAFGAAVTYSATSILLLKGTGAQTFTSNGKGWGSANGTLVQAVTGTYTLQDDYVDTTSSLAIASGGLAANNHNVSVGQFSINTSAAVTVTMGSGTWSMYGMAADGGSPWSIGTHSSTSFDAGTSTIKMVNTTAKTFAGGGLTYYNLWNAPGASAINLTITGANTFNDIKDDGTAAHVIIFPASTTTTTTTFHVSGTPGKLIGLHSSSSGTQFTINSSAGTINCDYLEIKDSNATGATWNAGLTSTNTSNNTGWLFTQRVVGLFLVF